MDFLDSLDLDTSNKKSHRVRSWYLYEQFKSLEKNQIDAAQKLKDRSYQEKILRRELSERRARRKLYDQFGLCQSESIIKKRNRCDKIKPSHAMSVASDDFFETFSEYQDEERVIHEPNMSEDGLSQDDSVPEKSCGCKSVEDLRDETSYAGSVNSVVENVRSEGTVCDDIREEVEFTTGHIVDHINKQLDAVEQNIQYIENMTKMNDDDKISEDESVFAFEKSELKQVAKKNQVEENSIIAIWSRLVSFAYQVIQLNRGNCYYDYSSQFLTAVLACDVLRRGVSRMCHILQPYVSPINYTTNEFDEFSNSYKNVKRKKSILPKKIRKAFEHKLYATNVKRLGKMPNTERRYSDNCWQYSSNRSFEDRNVAKKRYASEPWRSVARISFNKELLTTPSNSIWPSSKEKISSNFSKEVCNCCCHKKAVNPMLKIARYIDSILNDLDESRLM